MRNIVIQHKETIEWCDQRFYKHDNGEYYPSVTTILDAFPKTSAFFEWLKKNGENSDQLRDDAGASGSKIHQATEAYDRYEDVIWDDKKFTVDEWQMVSRYVEFSEKYQPEIIANEANYVSEHLKCGGTLDRIIKIDNRIILVDIKTSNYLWENFWVQLSAYQKLFNEFNPDLCINDIAILHLKAQTRGEDKKGKSIQGAGWCLKFAEKPVDYYFDLFQATYKLWLVQNPHAKPLNKVFPSRFQKDLKEVAA